MIDAVIIGAGPAGTCCAKKTSLKPASPLKSSINAPKSVHLSAAAKA